MTVFLIVLLSGMYLGVGLVFGLFYLFISILGNDAFEAFLAFTAPITWPILLWRMFR